MTEITIDDHVNPVHVTDYLLNHVAAHYYLPGEKVVESDYRGQPKETDDRQHKGELTIIETRIMIKDATTDDANANPKLVARYAFAEIEGFHDAANFCPKEGFVWHYGTVIKIDDQLWMVPLTITGNDYGNPSPENPLMIDTELTRGAKLCFRLDSNAGDFDFFEAFIDDPMTGEAYLIPVGDNHYQLDHAPWWRAATYKEVVLAKSAISGFKSRQSAEDEATPSLS